MLLGGAGCARPSAASPGATASGARPGPNTSLPEHAPSTEGSSVPQLALGLDAGPTATGQAITRAQQAVRDNPGVVEAYTALASALLKRRRETSNPVFIAYAEDVLRAASLHHPADPQVRLLTTMVLLEQHRFSAAADKARALAVALPNNPTPQLLLGDALLELGDYDGSADAFQAAMNLRPDLRSYNRAAHMRWLYGDFDGALEIMDLAIDAGSLRDPEGQAWCFADLGAMYLARGDGRRAKASADRALALVPEYIPGLIVTAKAYAAMGNPADAIATMRKVVHRRATVEDLLTLSEWLDDAGNAEGASLRRSQAERLADEDPRPMAHFLARHGDDPEEALRLAKLELSARKNIAAYDTLALALLRNGRAADAAKASERARSLGTADAGLLLHAAMIDAALGHPSEAAATLDRALALNPDVDKRLVGELSRAVEGA